MGGWVYIMTNRVNGTLCVGVTSNLARRIWEHRNGLVEGFTKRYGLKRLVFVERYETVLAAIQREHNIKHWPRHWALDLRAKSRMGRLIRPDHLMLDGRDKPGHDDGKGCQPV